MIPYFEFTEVQIGPITLYVWGFFVALGILVGLQAVRWFGKKRGLRDGLLIDLATGGVLGGVIGARLGYVLFYNLGYFLQNPFDVIKVWDGGMSMTGGLIGAVLMIVWLVTRRKEQVLPYCDGLVFGLPLGYGIGRIGCFLIHDHPGTATDFVLGVEYPDGVTRHDHGLYLSIFGFVMAAVFMGLYWLERAKKIVMPDGSWTSVYFVAYGLLRFWLDFYRIRDAVYFGLTPAQWISLGFVGGGVFVLWRVFRKK
jgi:phosphatidylglycerol:prolipoprotein diacylglycerol transferase